MQARAVPTALPSEVRPTIIRYSVEEYAATDEVGYAAATAEASWERLDAWANTRERCVVRKQDLPRLLDFTTKMLLVRRQKDGHLAGCALISEAPRNTDLCDTLHSHRNPSLPLVKTARMSGFGPIHPGHVRSAFDRALGGLPIDELVLICGDRGVGAAVMAHLRGRRRILLASVVPGCPRVRRFYDAHFSLLPFERRDGELPYATWLGGSED